MMKSFGSLLKQDLTIAYRNGFFYVVLGMALVFTIILQFAVPEDVSVTPNEYIVDLTEGKVVSGLLLDMGFEKELLLGSEEELLILLKEETQSLGIVFKGSSDHPQAVIYHQGNESQKALKGLETAVASVWNQAGTLGRPTYHQYIEMRTDISKPPFNKGLVPMLLAVEVIMLGFIFVAVMVFQEKKEGSVKAYRVSPSGTLAYILAKVSTNVILSFIYGFLLLIFVIGIEVEIIPVLILVVIASTLMTILGLLVSVFFNSISDFIYTALLFMIMFFLPVGAYFFPAFRLEVFQLIPSYPLMFGIRELLFPTGKTGFYIHMMFTLIVQSLILLLLCKQAVEKRLMKEGY